MTIQNGTRLGPYEVVSAIGAGGMGEVYRASDERIGRDVAIKVLPESFAGNEERLRRFEQEARTAGGLNHPNLVTIYDIGRHEGAPYLVMELLEGESLREKLGAGSGTKVPVRKAIEYATQITHGLAAAHDKGIIHRDLKPDNVFVTNDGRVKILDFGLAKQEATLSEGVTDQQTAQRDTSPGAVMGTVGYMSPEQVRGRQVDQRTDIFAFGTILYEMLSGARAFRGESTADTMSAILNQDPPELSGEGLPIPPALDRIVHRCLEKNREERFHSAHDLALALELLSGSSLSSSSGAVPAAHEPSPGAKRVIAITAVIAAIVGAFLLGRSLSRDVGANAGVATKQPQLTQLTFLSGSETNPGISPDGGTVVYSAGNDKGGRDIFVLRVGGENPVNLTGDLPGDNIQPAFSPDGRSIAFANVDSHVAGLYVMGATGETRRRLTDVGADPCWTPDGRAILISTEPVHDARVRNSDSTLRRVDLFSMEAKPLDTGGQDAVQPAASPDGKRIAFWGLPAGTGKRVIYTMSLEGGAPVAVTDDDFFNWNPKWSPDGARLFFSSNRSGTTNLWSVAIDPGTGGASGPFEPVTVASQFNGQMSIASDGSIVFGAATVSSRLVRVPVDSRLNAVGPREVMVSGSRELWSLDLSPDGNRVAFKGFDNREDLFVVAADGSGIRRLTNDRFKDRQPTWGADSESIYFYSDRTGKYEAWRIRADGSRLEQVTLTPDANGSVTQVRPSPDGKHLSMGVGTMGNAAAVGEIDGALPISSWITLPNPDERTGLTPRAWAHSGKRFVASGIVDGSTRAGAWVCEVASGCRRISEQGVPVAWTSDDRNVVLRGFASGRLRLVDVETLESSEGLQLPASVPDVRSNSRDVVLTADGKWLWYVETENEQDIWMLASEGMDER